MGVLPEPPREAAATITDLGITSHAHPWVHVEDLSCLAAMSSSQDDTQSRFAHLLQPIRDLAANWDIDVAKELEDYLVWHWIHADTSAKVIVPLTVPADTQETLEDISFSFEGGPSLNFAEGKLAMQLAGCPVRQHTDVCWLQLPC